MHRPKRTLLTAAIALAIAASATLSLSAPSAAQDTPLVALPVGTSQASYQGHIDAFLQGMADLGYLDGQNVRYEFRFSDGNPDLYAPNAAELVALGPAVIVAAGSQTRVAAAATSTIPVVIGFSNAATMATIVSDLEHPGGNVTGLLLPPSGVTTLLPLTRELLPDATSVGLLVNPEGNNVDALYTEANELAVALGFSLVTAEAPAADDVVPAFESLAAQGVDVVVVSGGSQFLSQLRGLAEAAATLGIPTVYQQQTAIDEGGLITIGGDQIASMRDAARLVDRILKGESPANIPIAEANATFIGVNLAAASALGLTVPQSILDRATQIIE